MVALGESDAGATPKRPAGQLKRTSQTTPRLGLVKGMGWGTPGLGLALAGRRVRAGVCEDQAGADLEAPATGQAETHIGNKLSDWKFAKAGDGVGDTRLSKLLR